MNKKDVFTGIYSITNKLNNKKYIGRGRYHLNESVTVGDTIIIVYDKKNPDYSKTMNDYIRIINNSILY